MQVRSELGKVKMVLKYFFRVGGATAYLGGATVYLVGGGGKMNSRIRLTSAKVGVGVEAETELGNIKLTKLNLGATKMKHRCNLYST